ncbi:Hypothetical protein CINCED_3A007405 [Cinara cedri]|uniref:Uncharacterized protein n=1 Tax=Cinara cedri TaxID=506608 RepID=A0A5E4M041_9HEMI|nr:Hypothetical protein CINCED_3A007405 [Cinara cedri]
MPNLPPFFNGKISGVLTLSVLDIYWYKNGIKSSHVQFEWTGSQEKHKLLTSQFARMTYDIRTSYKLFLNYLSTSTLTCSVKSSENKTIAHATIGNLLMLAQDNQLVKTLPLINNEKTVGILKLCFNLKTFNDTSFDNDIKLLTQFGIKNEVLNNIKPPVSSLSSKTNRSKEELASDYLMGKDMAPEEEKEALSALTIMPSAESIVSAAENNGIYSTSLSPLCVQGHTKMMTKIKPSIQNIKTTQVTLKKPFTKLHSNDLKKDFYKKSYKASVPKDDVYMHISVLSINVYRTVKSLQNYINSTYIVQCLKDQEPYKSLRFLSRHVDDNVVKFTNCTLSSRLEGSTVKGVTIKAYVRLLSERNPIVLGETKEMLDWTGFSTTLDVSRYIKVPIWNNNKITGHLSLSYKFSKTFTLQKHEDNFSEKLVENIIEIEDSEKEQCKPIDIHKSVHTINKKKNEDLTSYQMKDQHCFYNQLYPENNKEMSESQLFIDEWSKNKLKIETKDQGIQTNLKDRSFNKSVQTLIKTFNIAIQVNTDELEDPLDKVISYDIQNIFRCTHEFTFYIKKKFNSTFNYVTYQFPECVTNNMGKVIKCCRMFRTFGNTNILHLITLPTTTPLETYFYNNYTKSAIVLNLHQVHDYSSGKVLLLVSDLIDIANEFKTSYVTKNLVLNNNLTVGTTSDNNVHIKINYKRVYHSLPSPEKSLKDQPYSQKPMKKNPKVIDLTESGSDSEDICVNKTYTLHKHDTTFAENAVENSTQTDPVPVKMSHNCKTQTEKVIEQQCITINNNKSNKIEMKTGNATQIDNFVIIENQNKKSIRPENKSFGKLNDIIKAKITIKCGYNLPMVKLNGDTTPTAPTTYIIMEYNSGSHLSTSSVVQQTNPVWESEWTIVLPKKKLIEEKWLILELWCKKYKNEYAGHDAKRDARLGFILIDLCALEYDNMNQAFGLYDVISETEECHGQIKVMISQIDCAGPKVNDNYDVCVFQPFNKSQMIPIKEKIINQPTYDSLRNEIPEKIQTENNFQEELRKPKNPISVNNRKIEYIDITGDYPQNISNTILRHTIAETSLKNCYLKNDNVLDVGTSSSVTSWTSSSDDILYSNNPQVNQ